MCLVLEDERASLASEKIAEQGARAALMSKIAWLESQVRHAGSPSSERGDGEDYLCDQEEGSRASALRAAQTAATAASHAAFLAERENVLLRDQLQMARGAVHGCRHSAGQPPPPNPRPPPLASP